jgi:DNA invertase Pin-like site-specific DNA recombinase
MIEKPLSKKISGARSDRKQLARLLAELDDGDTVVVTRLDRLARSLHDAWGPTRAHRTGG